MTLLYSDWPLILYYTVLHHTLPYIIQISHIYFISLRTCVTFLNFFIFCGDGLLAPRPTPKLEDSPYQLSVIAYSIYLQLPLKPASHLVHPQLEDAPHHSDGCYILFAGSIPVGVTGIFHLT